MPSTPLAVVAGELMRTDGEAGKQIKRLLSIAMVNTGVIGLIVAGGIAALSFVGPIAGATSFSPGIIGLILGGILGALSVPPGMTLWRALSEMADEIAHELVFSRMHLKRESFTAAVAALIGHSFFAVALFIIAVWMTPLLWELVSVGQHSTPASVLIMVGAMALTARVALKIHSSLEEIFEQTFLGIQEPGVEGLLDAAPNAADKLPASEVLLVDDLLPRSTGSEIAPQLLERIDRGASMSGLEW